MARSDLYRSTLPVLLLWAWTAAVGQCAATAAPEAPQAKDPRLDQRITLDLARVPLSNLCAVVERRSGVAHRAADAATADLLASVVGTLTVAQLQQALGEVLGVGWKREGAGEAAGYVVDRLPAKRMEEAREQAEADRAFGESLRRMMAAANQPEGDEEQVPPRLRRLLERPGRREAFQVLGTLTPAEQARVLAGGGVERQVASLSPEGRARVKKMVEDLVRDNQRRADEQQAEPGGFRLRRLELPNLENGDAWRIRITARQAYSPALLPMFEVRVFRAGELGIGRGWGLPTAQPTGADPAENPVQYRLHTSGPMPEAAPADPPLPEPFQPRGGIWEEWARDLARILGRPVVSDAYWPAEYLIYPPDPAVREDSLERYLNRVCWQSIRRRWGRMGPVLLFQRRDRATRRREQIPESLARRWKQPIIDTGRISFDHMAEITALSLHQLPNLGQVLGPQADRVTEHEELLRLWKALPEAQRAALRGQGRVIRDLPLAVQPRARALVSGMLGSSAPLVLANARLRVEQTEEAFTFSVLSPERPAVVRRVELTCPAWFREGLRKEEEARVAALRAAGEAGQDRSRAAAGLGER